MSQFRGAYSGKERGAVLALVRDGISANEASRRTGVAARTILTWMRSAGIPVAAPGKIVCPADDQANAEKIRQWRASSVTWAEIGRRLGIPLRTVFDIAARHNIGTVTRGPAAGPKAQTIRRCLGPGPHGIGCKSSFPSSHIGNRMCRRCIENASNHHDGHV